MEWALWQPRGLWTVSTTVQRNQERVLGITGRNPRKIDPGWLLAAFQLEVTTQVNLPLTYVRIYCAIADVSIDVALPATEPTYPALGNVGDAIVEWAAATGGPPAAGNSSIRVPTALSNGATRFPLAVCPNRFLMEYQTGAPGATPNLVFGVSALFVAPEYMGQS